MGTAATTRLAELADRIEQDIASRGLRPGDAYLNTAETARLLRVSGTAANQALQLLAQRRVLVRKQRSGTFIGEGTPSAGPLHRVHLLVHQNQLKDEGLLADGVILGMQGQLPAADIQINFMPNDTQEEIKSLQGLVQEAIRSDQPEGFVLVRSTFEAQKILSDSGLPSVIYGTPYPSIELSWIDRDRKRSEQLLAEHLISRGCTQIGLIWRQRVLPSDPEGMEAVAEVLGKHQMPAGALHLRCLPPDPDVVKASVKQMMQNQPGRWGLICRSKPLAEAAASFGRKKFEVVVSDVYPKPSEALPFTHVRPAAGPQAIGADIGRLLVNQCRTGNHQFKSLAVERVDI